MVLLLRKRLKFLSVGPLPSSIRIDSAPTFLYFANLLYTYKFYQPILQLYVEHVIKHQETLKFKI